MSDRLAALRISLLENIHPQAVSLFREKGLTGIHTHKAALDGVELQNVLHDTHIMGIRSKTHLRAHDLSKAPHVEAIGCFCIGTDQVDLAAAAQMGIPVFNAPYANTRSVAELVLGQIIMLMRRVPEKSTAAHRGEWLKAIDGACEVRGKILGIVGYGHIGTQLSVLAESLGMRVMYYDVLDKLALGNAQRATTLEELLSNADIVTLHVPATKQTENMINDKTLSLMKKGAYLINASRGKVVDLHSLAQRIRDQHIGGAAIDVFPQEPHSNNDRLHTPLQNLPNVILTPHIGGSTLEAQENIAFDVAEKLLRYCVDGSTAGAVNFPQVTLPPLIKGKRFRHVHHNQPGVLTQINDVFSSHQLNIAAQYLQTDNKIGYVVVDTDTALEDTSVVLSALRAIPGTIRTACLTDAITGLHHKT